MLSKKQKRILLNTYIKEITAHSVEELKNYANATNNNYYLHSVVTLRAMLQDLSLGEFVFIIDSLYNNIQYKGYKIVNTSTPFRFYRFLKHLQKMNSEKIYEKLFGDL